MSTKKKTILRIKRKFSDLPAVDTIVLSQTTQPKKQKTVPWTELCQSFDKNFTINDNDNDKNKNCNEKKVDTNIDFNFNNCKPKSKKQVFRLISNEKEISRHFQQNTFNEKYSKNRKSKILQQRRSNRQNYFEKIKKEINNNDTNNNNNNNNNNKNNNNILQHDDFCDNTNAINTKAKPINKNKNIKMIQNKLLQKQKLNRTTKIVSKKQIKEHQKQLKLKTQNNNNNNNNKSSFSDDWNNNNLITLNYNGERINMKNFLNKYDCFSGYKPKNISEKGINIIDVEFDEYKQKYVKVNGNNKERENEYDYYELDEETDANEVIMAIQMRIKEKEKQKEINEMNKEISGDNNDNKLDLEWKLENIKNKYLTEIEMERNKLISSYHERVINIDVNEYDNNNEENGEEIERDDECHRDNEYPDEHEFSDDEYNLYNIEDDYFPRYNDEYYNIEPEIVDPTNNYSENAFDIEFFKNCDFN